MASAKALALHLCQSQGERPHVQLLCSCFDISRGVKQDSVLSPMLFLTVMDCNDFEKVGMDSMSEGGAIHAEDLLTTAGSSDSLSKKNVVLNSFASDSCLKVNTTKFEVIQIFSQLQ